VTAKKKDPPRRSADRRPGLGGNLVWPLIAAGVAGLFAMSLIGSTPELEFSYSDLERLVSAAKAEGDARWAATAARRPATATWPTWSSVPCR
jgi:hypothetical protein